MILIKLSSPEICNLGFEEAASAILVDSFLQPIDPSIVLANDHLNYSEAPEFAVIE